MRITVGRAYAGEITVLPKEGAAHEEEVLEVEHGGHGVGKETQEMWEGDVGDAVGWEVLPTTLYNVHSTMNLPVQTQ